MLPILWHVCEEHWDEAAFLYQQWERASSAADYTSEEVARGVQARLLAHLAGLVIGGRPVAERLLVPALSSDDPAQAFVAGWALLQTEEDDHLERVWEALLTSSTAAPRLALVRAFELCGRADVVARLRSRRRHPAAVGRACVLDVLATHQPEQLELSDLSDPGAETDGMLLASTLRASRHLPSGHEPWIERGFESPHPEARAEALCVGVLRKMPQTRPMCRRIVSERGPDRRLAMALLALQGDAKDLERLLAWSSDPELAIDALWALGFGGGLQAMDALATHLDDARLGPMAADSLRTLTGLSFPTAPAETQPPLAAPFDPDAAVPELRAEDELPTLDGARARAEWQTVRPRFQAGGRYVMGDLWSDPALLRGLQRVATWRRRVLHLGLSPHAAGLIRLRGWAR